MHTKRRRAHLAVVLPRYMESILAGRKVVEVRLSVNRCAPFGRVAPGDTVYFKERGGPVRASAVVIRVDSFADLTPARVRELARRYATPADAVRAAYWRQKRAARYATMIWFDNVREVAGGAHVPRLFGAAWVVLAGPAPQIGKNSRHPLVSARRMRAARPVIATIAATMPRA